MTDGGRTGGGNWDERALRVAAAVGLAALVVLAVTEIGELRGALAFARFDMARRAVRSTRAGRRLESLLGTASAEADLVMRQGSSNPEALWEISRASSLWSGLPALKDPVLRLELAERAARAAAQAARAAPSDYTHWLQLARTQRSLGLPEAAGACVQRARELAPPGGAVGQ